ncbi:MAG: sigma-70 family RNA polymerase sigma factor [Prevotellaceae bacterium]|nr:sigma-70 family RNA polymerase sigma factor [Prevotellaceae bacterium]
MKPKYRELIELRYIKEYAYEEIAEELNIPVGTVKTRLFRAKNMLAEMLLADSENGI